MPQSLAVQNSRTLKMSTTIGRSANGCQSTNVYRRQMDFRSAHGSRLLHRFLRSKEGTPADTLASTFANHKVDPLVSCCTCSGQKNYTLLITVGSKSPFIVIERVAQTKLRIVCLHEVPKTHLSSIISSRTSVDDSCGAFIRPNEVESGRFFSKIFCLNI